MAPAPVLRGDGDVPSAGSLNSSLNLLEARAQFDGPERAVHVRVAEHDGHIFVDLADEHWRAVDIRADGWSVVGSPPVRFRRPPGLLPLPLPQRGGSLEQLASLLNLSSQDDVVLVVTWLLAALRPSGPYPLLAISGEQGSAKTVLSKMLRALVDPNAAPVRALPREERELFIAANNGHVLAFDNISRLRSWLSDALCRLASGGGFRRAPALHRSARGAIRYRTAGHSQWHRGSHHPAGPRGPIDLLDISFRHRRTAAVGARTMAAIRARSSRHPRPPPRSGCAWIAHTAPDRLGSPAPHG